jgi:hypothetical protein
MNINFQNLSCNKLYTITLIAPINRAEFIYKTNDAIFTYIMEDEYIIITNGTLDLTEFNEYMLRVKRDHNMNEIIYEVVIYSNDETNNIKIIEL